MVKIYRIVLTDSPLGCPFAPKKKPVLSTGAALLAAGIAATASTVGTIANAASQSSANAANQRLNEQNIQMQRETNKQNYEMFQQQMAYNTDMWNKTNAYNAPKEVVNRLLAAGINPAQFFGQGAQASNISAPNAPQNTAPYNAFQMQAQDFSGMSDLGLNAVNAYNASRLAQAEVRNKEALTGSTAFDTTFKKQSMADNLKYLHGLAKEKGYLGEIARQQLQFIKATQQFEIDLKFGDLTAQKKSYELMNEQLKASKLQNDILDIQRGSAKELSQAQIASLWSSVFKAKAEVGLINANAALTEEQRLHEIEKRISTTIDNGMRGLDFEIKREVKGAIIQNYKNEANIGMWNAFDAYKYGRNGDSRSAGDMFRSLDDFGDFTKRVFQRKGFIPKF